ncbi:hypothetical protein K3G63_03340 [Hymenobacter sp. HSC-4F20]|uniref:hypothetical protein n=1 Tax=Hymenobacter sp. HSC-4F20 TaxID=2864135 RepID=UPI001C73CDFC|nr:hypothetical protein [Hymenobacter sp. HSC-4F20]MBX0289453.1 hypothetical protein [Hymenobacter sp. HSC-4F20]
MKRPITSSEATSSPFPPARTALRELYRTVRHLHYTDPYAQARLARIADQAEYFLQAWPANEWPENLHATQALPPREVLLAWVATAKSESTRPWTYAVWQQATTLLLATLVPFT